MGLKNDLIKLKSIIFRKIYMSNKKRQDVTDQFHRLFYDAYLFDKTWATSTWFGVHAKKCPFDLWVYQEIMQEIKPDLIIEGGTSKGGSAYYLATLCDIIGKGQIVTIDIEDVPGRPIHPRIEYVLGSTLGDEVLMKIEQKSKENKVVLVILDDNHEKEHVLKEMIIYSKFVSNGSYMIVEDSNVNGHPVDPQFGPGPYEAIEEFMKSNKNFLIDKDREKFYLTFNPNGYLKRIK